MPPGGKLAAAGVTGAASRLERQGVISYRRGMIEVLDRRRLESLSCECYSVVKKETDRLLPYLPKRNSVADTDSIPTVTLRTA